MDSTNDDLVRGQLENQKVRLQEELREKEKPDRMLDQFLDTGEILFQYQDMQDAIAKGATGNVLKKHKRKPGDVLSALEDAAAFEGDDGEGSAEADVPVHAPPPPATKPAPPTATPATKSNSLSRDDLLEKQLQKTNPGQTRKTNEITDSSNECSECGADMTFSQNEAMLFCPECGATEFILIDSDRPSQKDPPRESSYYAYKRINHFNELLAQFQAKESTEIPQDTFDTIVAELKKQRIENMGNLKHRQMRDILRKLKLNRLQDHIPHIINRLNGNNAPVMDRETEEKLRHMFKEIQPSFQKHCPKNRRNFLSQAQVLQKFCELLGLDEFLASFPLLKNRDKLQQQSKIWQLICADMKWEQIRSI